MATAVYRIYGRDESLLYVGLADNVFVRLEQHVAGKPWWSDVDGVSVELFATREIAFDAELRAIRTESPRYNLQGTGGHGQRRATPEEQTPVSPRQWFTRRADA